MKRLCLAAVLLFITYLPTLAQHPFEAGIRGGATFTHGYTNIPPISTTDGTIPALNNQNNGVGRGYVVGLWARRAINSFFVQAEVNLNEFLLNQRVELSVPADVAFRIARLPRPSQLPAQTPTTINMVSASTLRALTVPVLFGKTWANRKIRAFAGPYLLITSKAEVRRDIAATLGSTTLSVPTTTSDLKNPDPQNQAETALAVKNVSYGAEAGVGYTFFRRIDLDVRYAAPVGGIYKNTNVKGYVGIATVSLGVRLL